MKVFILALLLFSINSWSFTLSCPSTSVECEGWAVETLSIEFNPSDCPATLRSEIEEAIELWNEVSTSFLKLEIGADNNDTPATIVARVSTPEAHTMVIACDTAFQTTLGFSAAEADAIPGVANSNTVTGNSIDVGFVLLNVQAGASANINNLSAELRKVVIAHEVGHALGIGHSEAEEALMFFNATAKENLSLNQDDIDALSYLYPRDEPSDEPLGCGVVKGFTGGPPSHSALLLLLFFLPVLLWGRLRLQSVVR